jgi:hypothetical protein
MGSRDHSAIFPTAIIFATIKDEHFVPAHAKVAELADAPD